MVYFYNPRLHPDDGTAPYTYSYIQKGWLVVRMKKKSQHTASLPRQLVQHAYPDDGTALRDHQGEVEFVQATRPQAGVAHMLQQTLQTGTQGQTM